MTEKRLLDNGDGLFDTHVYVEEIQNSIKDEMKTNAQLGPDTKYTVIGDGNGFMSRVILVEPDWTEVDENLPEKFILKITSCLHVQALSEKLKVDGVSLFTVDQEENMFNDFEREAQLLHNREVELYRIFDELNLHQKLLAPKVFFAKKFDETNKLKGYLGMEFVENSSIRHLYENLEITELYPILRALAILQVKSLVFSEDQIKRISGYDIRELMGKIMDDAGIKGMLEAAKNVDESKLSQITEKLKKYGTKLFRSNLIHNLNENIGIHRDTLVHGDLWSANILWNCKNGEKRVSKIIDYQIVHFGNPAEDLIRLFLSTLSGNDCHTKWEELVEKFYGFLIDELNGEDAPYTLEQLKESYKIYYVTGALIMLMMFGPVAQMKIEYSDAENKEKLKEILAEKTQRMMEDIDYYHIYTEKKFPTV